MFMASLPGAVDPRSTSHLGLAEHPRLRADRRSKTWMAGTSPAMTEINFDRYPCVIVTGCPGNSRRKRSDIRSIALGRLVTVDADNLPQPVLHGLAQVITRPAERSIAARDERLLCALQRSDGADAHAHVILDHQGVHRIDLAVEIGQFRIGADRLLDRAFG